jgi:translocation and assembly module TamB
MSESESIVPDSAVPMRKPNRLRRFFLLHLPVTMVSAVVLLVLVLAGLYLAASSVWFENYVRQRIVRELEADTGGRVEIAAFHWHLLSLDAEADGVVLHGLEAPGEAPLAQIGHLRIQLSLLNFWSRTIRLRDLEITEPQVHLIVYPGGATNLPQPQNTKKSSNSALDTLFDLKVGRVAAEQGTLHYEDRAAALDFQNRFLPLDFSASDLALHMSYIPSHWSMAPASYHIEAGATNLTLMRGSAKQAKTKSEKPPVEGYFQATLDLTRNAAVLRSLRITTHNANAKDRTLEISGTLTDFGHPHWQAKAAGELDMKLLDPITGYPFSPEGIAHLDLNGSGQADQFRTDGSVRIEDGSYIGTGVIATGIHLDARVHADQNWLLISSIVARLRQGGQLEGSVALEHWLPPSPIQPQTASKGVRNRLATPPADEITIPVNGKVIAEFKEVSIDTLMDMVSQKPFLRLGFDARINGPATATWVKGDVLTLAVTSLLHLTPSAHPVAGEAPASGIIDGTYTQRDGAVDLRSFELRLPSSELQAQGHLGAYPLTSTTGINVTLHTGNLGEFDAVLRDLGLTHNGKVGTGALPGTLTGQADFRGTWSGSLTDPHIAGTAKATQLAIEIPAIAQDKPAQFLPWDAAEASGSYSAARISIDHSLLKRGDTEIAVYGTLTAAPVARASLQTFDRNSQLHLHLRANKLSSDDLLPLIGSDLPVTGTLDTQLQADGPVHQLNGSGWIELANGKLYGEPFEQLSAQGTLADQVLKLATTNLKHVAGNLVASGSYNLNAHNFQFEAQGSGLDVARIDWLHKQNLALSGKLGLSVTGSGTFDDPRLQAHATLTGLAAGDETLGDLKLDAHTANRTATYDVTSQMETAQIKLHGRTALSGEYATQARLDFSQFDIGSLLKMARVKGLSGQSSLAGTVTIEGPLAKLDEMRGDARLQELALTVSGVHLKSEGSVHATLANARITLDPLHITGEETDLRAHGTLALKDKQQLDIAANGSINLKLAQTLDPDLTASGATTFEVEAHGPLMNPSFKGQVDFQNGALALEDLPNGLSQIHGTLVFNQNRLEVKSLTAMTGGGQLSVGGSLSWQNGLFADLVATGDNIRLRYPEGISSLGNATLRLQGTHNNLLLSGNVLITRFAVSPDLDIAALATQANAVETIASPDAPSNHIRLDVHVASSPQLNFQNSFAKLAGDVDLRLRGTLATPSLLGQVSITEGSATIAGTRYELQRGEVSFTNPVRIQPNIDLNATAHVEDYDISLGLHGTTDKLAVTYRSDPPLPEADVVALLALGRTQNQQRLYTQQQEQTGASPTTDSLLGGALNASVSSRVQKLFGAGSVKVDPNYLGTLGNSTSRIIVEEQLGPRVTLTYATNVNTTAQQLLQAEVTINHHVSLLVARDESGVFSMVVKATRRYR